MMSRGEQDHEPPGRWARLLAVGLALLILVLVGSSACRTVGSRTPTAANAPTPTEAAAVPSQTPESNRSSPEPPQATATSLGTEESVVLESTGAIATASRTIAPSPSALHESATPAPGTVAALPSGTPEGAGPFPEPTQEADVFVWEQDIVLNTYGWQDALRSSSPSDSFYPYPRLDFDAVGLPQPRTYRAIFLQNQYVQLVVVPELGGRILRWTDRTTGRQLFYANPVVKPTHWGYRGWWLATGGMEWAFPTEEHGLDEYRPWQHERLWNGVHVWDTDDRTGMTVEVWIRLDGQHNSFSVTPRISNTTDTSARYQFWANAMLALSDVNAPSPDLVFILPDDVVTVHSTGDASLPAPGEQMVWAVIHGRDFSRYAEWRKYLGVFADPAQADFVGAYDQGIDEGVVRVFPHEIAKGVKFFCMGDLSADLWTDDGSRYFELWAGVTPTFWDYAELAPGASVSWTEYWYPVSGIGGYNWANAEAAIRLLPAGDRAEIAVATTHALQGTVILLRGGVDVARWEAAIAPGQPFRAAGQASGSGNWGVLLLVDGRTVAQMGP